MGNKKMDDHNENFEIFPKIINSDMRFDSHSLHCMTSYFTLKG